MAVQAGENGARQHHLAGLVPTVRVAETRSVTLTLPVEDGIQPGEATQGVRQIKGCKRPPVMSLQSEEKEKEKNKKKKGNDQETRTKSKRRT